jgi:hypothetical protein
MFGSGSEWKSNQNSQSLDREDVVFVGGKWRGGCQDFTELWDAP